MAATATKRAPTKRAVAMVSPSCRWWSTLRPGRRHRNDEYSEIRCESSRGPIIGEDLEALGHNFAAAMPRVSVLLDS
jgi:hypothetical protein